VELPKTTIIDLGIKASDLVADDEEAAMNEEKPIVKVKEEVEEDWRLRLPAFLRSNLNIPETEELKVSEASTSTLPVDPNAPNPLSKNAMKKAAKLAKMEETKLARRAEEKQKAKARKVSQKAEYKAGNMTPEEAAEYLERQKERTDKLRARQRGGRAKDKDAWKGGLVIDLAFDELMQPGVGVGRFSGWLTISEIDWLFLALVRKSNQWVHSSLIVIPRTG
jgi:hypothetical protein